MSNYFRQFATKSTPLSERSWAILNKSENSIKQKIEKIGTPLKNWDVSINYGIKTGFNEAFIINTQQRNEFVKKCPEVAEIIRPILLGKNVKRYEYNWNNTWIIFTRRGIDIEKYPDIKEYLLKFYNQLRPRNNNETSGRKPGSYKWYEIQDNVAYYNNFEKSKIVWGNLALRSQFSFVDEGFYVNVPSAFIPTDNLYLLAVLNSKIGDYYLKQVGVSRSGGYMEYKPMFVEQLPIPQISESEQAKISKLVLEVLEKRKKGIDTMDIEKSIDEIVFELYQITSKEVEFLLSTVIK